MPVAANYPWWGVMLHRLFYLADCSRSVRGPLVPIRGQSKAGRFRRLMKRSSGGKSKRLTNMKEQARKLGWNVGPKTSHTALRQDKKRTFWAIAFDRDPSINPISMKIANLVDFNKNCPSGNVPVLFDLPQPRCPRVATAVVTQLASRSFPPPAAVMRMGRVMCHPVYPH